MRAIIEAQRAGLSRGDTLDRLFALTPDVPLRIWWEDGASGPEIVWELVQGGDLGARRARPYQGILAAFFALAGAKPEKVVQFAQRYGVFWLYGHGFAQPFSAVQFGDSSEYGDEDALGPFRQPIQRWRELAREAELIVRCGAMLRREMRGSAPWAELATLVQKRRGPALRLHGVLLTDPLPETVAERREYLERLVGEWLYFGDVRPEFRWRGTAPTVSLKSVGALGAVARNLALALANVDGWATCSGCQAPFMPSRKPAVGRRAWCDACKRDGLHLRQAKRDQRTRQTVPEREHARRPGRQIREEPGA